MWWFVTALPADLQAGDILAVPATGAYCYVLGSNYNFFTRPPVIATAQGQPSRVMIRRQHEEDMLALDMVRISEPLAQNPYPRASETVKILFLQCAP